MASAQPNHSARYGDWYWTSGWCKSQLQHSGVQINDGRTFSAAKAYCIGLGGEKTCQWNENHSQRRYTTFYVILRSYDGTVRTMYLGALTRTDYRVNEIRLRYRYMDAAKFATYNDVIGYAFASTENAKGCAP